MVETPFQKFVKGVPNHITAPKDEEKYALKTCMGTFSIFWMLSEIKEVFYEKHV